MGEVTGVVNAEERVLGTAAISMFSAEHGAQMVRVHDVKQTKQVLDMYYGISRSLCVCYNNRGSDNQLFTIGEEALSQK